jgi:hypothetical protein
MILAIGRFVSMISTVVLAYLEWRRWRERRIEAAAQCMREHRVSHSNGYTRYRGGLIYHDRKCSQCGRQWTLVSEEKPK